MIAIVVWSYCSALAFHFPFVTLDETIELDRRQQKRTIDGDVAIERDMATLFGLPKKSSRMSPLSVSAFPVRSPLLGWVAKFPRDLINPRQSVAFPFATTEELQFFSEGGDLLIIRAASLSAVTPRTLSRHVTKASEAARDKRDG